MAKYEIDNKLNEIENPDLIIFHQSNKNQFVYTRKPNVPKLFDKCILLKDFMDISLKPVPYFFDGTL